jgi:hypothetical protein
VKIKEAPGFLLIGLVISLVLLFSSVALYVRDGFSMKGWANEYLSASIVFLFITFYFGHNIRKSMEEPHDQDRCG